MKKVIILTLALLCIINQYCKAQQIGDDAEKVKNLVQMHMQEYYSAQGYNQVREVYKVLMSNGSISEIVLQKENVPDMNLQRPISFRIRYVMKTGKLNRILTEYFDVSISELANSFKDNYRGNSINDYYFNSDYSTYTRIYLGSDKLATVETKKAELNDFPTSIREIIKKGQLATTEQGQKNVNTQSEESKVNNYVIVDKEAQFSGGPSAFLQYLNSHLRYPDTAFHNDVEGTVLIQFLVEKDGSITDVKVLEGEDLGYGLADEAVRVIANMPKWIPARQGDRNVRSYKKQPIAFRLPAESNNSSIKYNSPKAIFNGVNGTGIAWFTGTKLFCDGLGGWYYKVTISGNKITLQQYADRKNKLHKDKINPVETIQGVIEANKIITRDAPEYKTNRFKFENGVLYEVNNEGDYNSYQECQK